MRSLFLLSGLALLGTGCRDKNAPLELSGGQDIGAGTWNVHVTVGPGTPPAGFPVCTGLDFVMHIVGAAGGAEIIVAHSGAVHKGTLVKTEGVYKLSAALEVPTAGAQCAGIGAHSASLGTLSMIRKGDELVGRGQGNATYQRDDLGLPHSFEFTLAGKPDKTLPKIQPVEHPVHPIYEFRVVTNKPLAPEAALSLTGTTVVPLSGSPDYAPGTFSTQVILPFSGTWKVAGTAKDLGGNPLDLNGEIRTQEDPGIFAQDGFEGKFIGRLTERATIHSSDGKLPAISGKKSLRIDPFATASLHLVRKSNEKTLRFTARIIPPEQEPGGMKTIPNFTVGVVGGTKRVRSDHLYRPEQTEYVLTLDDPGNDVIVHIQHALTHRMESPRPTLIDDLRLE